MHLALRHLCVALLSVTALASQPPDSPKKQPWEWTDDERIAMLMDPSAAARRVQEDVAAGKVKLGNGPRPNGVGMPVDSLSGARDPHLFLPHELFDSLVTMGFADDAVTREAYRGWQEDARVEAGLPDDLWDRLEVIAAGYLDAQRREREIAFSTIPEPGKTALLKPVVLERCHAAYDARIAAEAAFGPAFRRFLYIGVVRGQSSLVYRQDPEEMKRLSRGCR
jgi:hypothetical protein